jgi:hypothetical protein
MQRAGAVEDDVVAKATALLSEPGVRPSPGEDVPAEEERPSTTNVVGHPVVFFGRSRRPP